MFLEMPIIMRANVILNGQPECKNDYAHGDDPRTDTTTVVKGAQNTKTKYNKCL